MVENLENQLKAALRVEVPASSKQRVRAEVMVSAEKVFAKRPAGRRRSRLLKPLPLAAALVLLLFVGTALAATGAQPDSWLYPLKQKAEDARVILALQGLDKAKAEVERAHKRLDEIEKIVASGKPDYLPSLLARYNGHMTRAEELVNEVADRGEAVDQVKDMIAAARARHDDLLRAMLDDLPEDVADEVRRQLGECPGCPVPNGEMATNGMPEGPGGANGSMNDGTARGSSGEMMPPSGPDDTMPAPESSGDMEGGPIMGPSPGGGVMDGGGMPSGTNGGSGPDSSMGGGDMGNGDPGGSGTGDGMSQPAPAPSAGMDSGGMSPRSGRP